MIPFVCEPNAKPFVLETKAIFWIKLDSMFSWTRNENPFLGVQRARSVLDWFSKDANFAFSKDANFAFSKDANFAREFLFSAWSESSSRKSRGERELALLKRRVRSGPCSPSGVTQVFWQK